MIFSFDNNLSEYSISYIYFSMKKLSIALSFWLLQSSSYATTWDPVNTPFIDAISTWIELKVISALSEESLTKIVAKTAMPKELGVIIGTIPYNKLMGWDTFQLEIIDQKWKAFCTLNEATKYAAWALENLNSRTLLTNIRPIFTSHKDRPNIREHLGIDAATLSFMKEISQAHALWYIYHKIVSYWWYNDYVLLYQRNILWENYPCWRSV